MGKIQKEILCLLKESQSSAEGVFDSQVLESKIPHEMRWKEWNIIDDNSGNTCLYWVTQQYYSKEQLEQFKKVLSDLYGDIFDCAFVIVRDDSTYDFNEDSASGRGDFITLGDSVNESVLTEKINKDNIEVNKVLANPNAGKNAQRIKDMGYETSEDSEGKVYGIRNPKTKKWLDPSQYSREEKKKVDFKGKLDSERETMNKTFGWYNDDENKVPKSQKIGKYRTGRQAEDIYDYDEQMQRREGISKNIKDYKAAVKTRDENRKWAERKREKDIPYYEKKVKDAQKDLEFHKNYTDSLENKAKNAEEERQALMTKVREKRNK